MPKVNGEVLAKPFGQWGEGQSLSHSLICLPGPSTIPLKLVIAPKLWCDVPFLKGSLRV